MSNKPVSDNRQIIRDATATDMPAVTRIYKHYVETALVTFEGSTPSLEEMLARRQKALDCGAPYLVAELGGDIVGYCYAGPYHHRPAYR